MSSTNKKTNRSPGQGPTGRHYTIKFFYIFIYLFIFFIFFLFIFYLFFYLIFILFLFFWGTLFSRRLYLKNFNIKIM